MNDVSKRQTLTEFHFSNIFHNEASFTRYVSVLVVFEKILKFGFLCLRGFSKQSGTEGSIINLTRGI